MEDQLLTDKVDKLAKYTYKTDEDLLTRILAQERLLILFIFIQVVINIILVGSLLFRR